MSETIPGGFFLDPGGKTAHDANGKKIPMSLMPEPKPEPVEPPAPEPQAPETPPVLVVTTAEPKAPKPPAQPKAPANPKAAGNVTKVQTAEPPVVEPIPLDGNPQ